MDKSDKKNKNHRYFTRSKKSIKDDSIVSVDELIKNKEHIKDFDKNVTNTIKNKIKNKAIFKKDSDDEDEDEYTSDEVDEYGNLKDFIVYDEDNLDEDYIPSKELIYEDNCELFTKIQESIFLRIQGGLQSFPDEIDKNTEDCDEDITVKDVIKNEDEDESVVSLRYKTRNIIRNYTNTEKDYFFSLTKKEQESFIEMELQMQEQNGKIPMRFQVLKSSASNKIKSIILHKLDVIQNLDKSNSEYYKIKNWVEGLLKIPFGKYLNLPISLDDGSKKIKKYLVDVYNKLDDAVFGHNIAKTQLIQIITKWITNPSSKGFVLGIQGPPGNGKTTLVRKGIAKAINKPFSFLTLGGATDASFLEGHSYTYEGSIPGRIVQILGEKNIGCMNPIIYFDELDKISDTSRGHEIHNILCHLTDFSQNDEFHDKYYSGIDFDLSKALFVFSFNDEHLINPILKDRMTIIKTKGFKTNEKIKLGRKYLLPELFNEVKMDCNLVNFSDDNLKYIIEKFTEEEGVRNFKRMLEKIISKLNVIYLLGDISDMDIGLDIVKTRKKLEFPLCLNNEIIDNLLTSKYDEDDKTSRSHLAMYM